MKKITLLVSLFIFNSVLAGESVIFNMSDKYDMDVSYRTCTSGRDAKNAVCTPISSLKIEAKKSSNNKNFYVMTVPDPTVDSLIWLEVISAVEKDGTGKIISQGQFANENGENCQCRGELGNAYNGIVSKVHYSIPLNDMHGSPYITCYWPYFYNN